MLREPLILLTNFQNSLSSLAIFDIFKYCSIETLKSDRVRGWLVYSTQSYRMISTPVPSSPYLTLLSYYITGVRNVLYGLACPAIFADLRVLEKLSIPISNASVDRKRSEGSSIAFRCCRNMSH